MTDPAPSPAPDQVITDDQLRAELERDPHLLHRLRADEERAYEAVRKAHVLSSDYLKKATSAIFTERSAILAKAKGDAPGAAQNRPDLAEARHILTAIATYRAIQEGARHLHRQPAGAAPVLVDPK